MKTSQKQKKKRKKTPKLIPHPLQICAQQSCVEIPQTLGESCIAHDFETMVNRLQLGFSQVLENLISCVQAN